MRGGGRGGYTRSNTSVEEKVSVSAGKLIRGKEAYTRRNTVSALYNLIKTSTRFLCPKYLSARQVKTIQAFFLFETSILSHTAGFKPFKCSY